MVGPLRQVRFSTRSQIPNERFEPGGVDRRAQPPIGSDEDAADGFGTSDVQAVIDRMPEFESDLQGAIDEIGRRPEPRNAVEISKGDVPGLSSA